MFRFFRSEDSAQIHVGLQALLPRIVKAFFIGLENVKRCASNGPALGIGHFAMVTLPK
jgi:hypothetical protein